jgi:hypothetical protein
MLLTVAQTVIDTACTDIDPSLVGRAFYATVKFEIRTLTPT